jgi:predicted alpha/beta hydrolase family esterase
MTTTLIVPGLNSSGSAHWQTWFEQQIPGAVRVIQSDWKRADLPEWSSRVRRTISRSSGPIIIVAHSFGVLAAVQAASDHSDRIAGALLVAPADPSKFKVEEVIPAGPLPFQAVLVASTNDPWMPYERARALAETWGVHFVNLGAAGHINAESGFGPWPNGLALHRRLEGKYASTNQRYAEGERSRAPAHASRVPISSSPHTLSMPRALKRGTSATPCEGTAKMRHQRLVAAPQR